MPAAPRRKWWAAALRVAGHPVFWIVLLGLAVRIGMMCWAQTYRYDRPPADDSSLGNSVSNIARSIVEGRGFSSPFSIEYTGPTAMVAPALPYLCAVAFKLGGVLTDKALFWLLLFQSVCSALTCVWIYQIAERSAGRKAALTAAVLWATFPWFAKWPVTWLWDTSLTAAVLTFLVAFAMQMAERPRRWMWAAFGAFWGIALLINPALVTLFPLMLLWVAASVRAQARRWIRPALLSTVVCVAVLTPWLVRNYVVFGQFVFLRSNFWLEFSIGNYHQSFGRGWGGRHPEMNLRELQRYKELGEAGYIRLKAQEARAYVRQYPGEFLALSAKRAAYFWDGSNMGYRPRIAAYWLPGSFAVLSYLAPFVLFYACLRRIRGWPLFLGAIVLYPLPYYFTYGAVRFRHAVEPLLLILIVYFASEAWAAVRQRWSTVGYDAEAEVPVTAGVNAAS